MGHRKGPLAVRLFVEHCLTPRMLVVMGGEKPGVLSSGTDTGAPAVLISIKHHVIHLKAALSHFHHHQVNSGRASPVDAFPSILLEALLICSTR